MQTKYTKKQITRFIFKILIVALAAFTAGVTFKSFFETMDVIPTGFSGLAMAISTWLSWAGVTVPTSIIYLAFNVVLFLVAMKFFNWKFFVLSGVGLGSYVLGMQFGFIEIIAANASVDPLLYVIVGAILSGLCIGICVRCGGSTGGTDILGTIVNHRFPKIKTGYCMLGSNIIVLIIAITTKAIGEGLSGGILNGLYALVIAVLSSLATNLILDRSKKIVAFHIICDKAEEIALAIQKHYGRGVTRLEGEGTFTHKNKAVLLCLVPYEQSYKMREFVLKIDAGAFVYSTPVTETIGEQNLLKLGVQETLEENQTQSQQQILPMAVQQELGISQPMPKVRTLQARAEKKTAKKATTTKNPASKTKTVSSKTAKKASNKGTNKKTNKKDA